VYSSVRINRIKREGDEEEINLGCRNKEVLLLLLEVCNDSHSVTERRLESEHVSSRSAIK
jgi:hypothetical protein